MKYLIAFPPGVLRLETDGDVLTRCVFTTEAPGGLHPGAPRVISDTIRQLTEYFAGERRTFDLPLAGAATPFQQRLREALSSVPFGQTITYGNLASLMDSPKAIRAVGRALGANPFHIIVPCHRVVGATTIGGYAAGTMIKESLLEHESSHYKH